MKKFAATMALALALIVGVGSSLSAQETTSYLVSWEPGSEPNITGYIIYRSLSPTDAFPEPIDTVGGTIFSYIDQNVLKGTTYYYRVKAMNSSGQLSSFSNTCSGLTIPQNAGESLKNLCRISRKTKTAEGSYEIGWTTAAGTVGFIQYDMDAVLDSMSSWDDAAYVTSHSSSIEGLQSQQTYFLRAVAYDENDNMLISAIDTLVVLDEEPQPLSPPNLSIYPVPYRPSSGMMTFADLPAGGSVELLNQSGIKVFSANLGQETSLTWNGTNDQGSPVASGIYFAIIRNASGDIVAKRSVMIVR